MIDVIETKLSPPYIRQQRMNRSAILKRMAEEAASVRFVSVVAPAGSGKSTLLVELHEKCGLEGSACAWLSLEAGDDEPARFARYISSVFRVIDKPFAETNLAYLKSSASADLTRFFDDIIEYIAAIDRRFTLFVDDFHVLKDPGILNFWTRFISYAPSSVRTVIASRSKLPLDLSRLRIAGGIFELGQNDLNLSVQETMRFMKEQHNVALPMPTVQLLHDRTEGWMVGLQLAGMAISKSDRNKEEIIRGFSARDRNLQEYLFEAVYGLQDEATRHFLLCTAPLNRFSAELCDVVTGQNDGYHRLAQLEAANLFILPLDREGHWYRYHHLFSEYLVAQLMQEDPGLKAQICANAADWCVGEGYVLEAIQYCLDASYFEKATDLIAEQAKTVAIGEGNHSIIFEWMRKLPLEYQYRRPEILLHHAWSRAFTRDGVGIAVSICDEFEKLLADTEVPRWDLPATEVQSLVHLCNVIRCITFACVEAIDDCLFAAKALLTELPKEDDVLIASASVASAFSYYLQKDLNQALVSAHEAYVYGRRGESAYAAIWADFVAAMTNIELGRIGAAELLARRAGQTLSEVSGDSQIAALAALVKAEVDCQRCDFDSLQQVMVDSRVMSILSSSPEPLFIARRNEARFRLWAGDVEAAREVLRQGQDLALTMDMPRLYFGFIAEEIELQLHNGDIRGARDTASRTDILNRKNSLITARHQSAVMEYIELTDARLLLAEGRGDEALKLLNMILRKAQSQRRTALIQQLRTMKSLALWALEKETEAMRELDKVVNSAAPELHMYPLYRVGSGLLVILQRLEDERVSDVEDDALDAKYQFQQQLIKLLSANASVDMRVRVGQLQPRLKPSALADPLTDRQLEILRLICSGLGNKELAQELHISLSTAKWHVHNIFDKLGVRNRTSAAAYARKINLI